MTIQHSLLQLQYFGKQICSDNPVHGYSVHFFGGKTHLISDNSREAIHSILTEIKIAKYIYIKGCLASDQLDEFVYALSQGSPLTTLSLDENQHLNHEDFRKLTAGLLSNISLTKINLHRGLCSSEEIVQIFENCLNYNFTLQQFSCLSANCLLSRFTCTPSGVCYKDLKIYLERNRLLRDKRLPQKFMTLQAWCLISIRNAKLSSSQIPQSILSSLRMGPDKATMAEILT
jgi:hypothetical protein